MAPLFLGLVLSVSGQGQTKQAQSTQAQSTRDLTLERRIEGRRVALVIGNADYPGHALANPVHDAEDFGAALAKAGFTVSVAKDASRQTMRALVTKFVGDLHDGEEDRRHDEIPHCASEDEGKPTIGCVLSCCRHAVTVAPTRR